MIQNLNSEFYMQLALKEAFKGFKQGEIPVGAVLVDKNQTIFKSYNQRERLNDFQAHAEILALTQAVKTQKNWRLTDSTLYVTLEPCPMCLGAILNARVKKLIFGCFDPKREIYSARLAEKNYNFFPSLKNLSSLSGNNHQLEIVSGVLAKDCEKILKDFFQQRRRNN